MTYFAYLCHFIFSVNSFLLYFIRVLAYDLWGDAGPSAERFGKQCSVTVKVSGSIYTSKVKGLFIYLFLAALGFRCYARAFSTCGERGLLFLAVRRFLITVASFVVEHGL